MKIFLIKRSYFTFRGSKSYELDILGKNTLQLMREHLGAEIAEDGLPSGDKVILYPVYPHLTIQALNAFLERNQGSFSFEGGYVLRGKTGNGPLGKIEEGLFSLSDYSDVLIRAVNERADFWAERGAFVSKGAQISYLAEIQEGAVVESGAQISGYSVIGKNAYIGSGSEITDSVVGEKSEVRYSILEKARVGCNCKIGPFAFLRKDSVVGDNCRVGDFVELKNCRFGNGSKAAHLSYIGDAEVGENVNVGCGVVFANYNGKTKSKSYVGDGSFIGSNCNLIAPVSVGAGCFVAAGTTLTRDLKEDDFCIGRSRESVKENGAKKYLKRK